MGLALNQRWLYSLGTSGWPHAWWKGGSEKQCLSLWGSLSGFRVSCLNNTASLGWFQALQLDIKNLRNLLQQLVSTRAQSRHRALYLYWPQLVPNAKENLRQFRCTPSKAGRGEGCLKHKIRMYTLLTGVWGWCWLYMHRKKMRKIYTRTVKAVTSNSGWVMFFFSV